MGRIAGACLGLLIGATLAAQERTFPVPANVTTDGVPPIPMPLVQAVAPYGQFRQAIRARHPTEREIIITTSSRAAVAASGEDARGRAHADDLLHRRGFHAVRAVFLPNGQSFVFQKDTAGGGEADQLFRYDLARGTTVMLTDGKSAWRPCDLSNWPHRVRLDRARRQEPRPLCHEPVGAWLRRVLVQGEGRWSAIDLSPDAQTILALQFVSTSKRISGPCVRIPARRR